ncbi:MAG: mltG, partial [Glaciihabitans sp.]|nr:mltG [Glaciihabitans sp.]
MADDPTRDEFPATPPTGAPFVPYQAPTRRQLRESEARAKAREAGSDDPVPLVEPPLHEARPFPLDADGTLNPALNRPSAPSQHESTSPAVAASTVATAPRVNGVPIHTTTVEELFAVDPETPWPLSAEPARKKPKKHRFVWLWVLLGLLLVAAGGAAAVWVNFEDQVREVFGWELQNDYVGSGNGEPITVTVVSGQFGSDIATTLYEAGVTMSYDAFYDLLVAQPTQPSFMPGTYQLQGEMSAQSALDVLVDPTNIVTSSFVVPEGTILPALLQRVSDGTGIPLADLQAVAADYTSLG